MKHRSLSLLLLLCPLVVMGSENKGQLSPKKEKPAATKTRIDNQFLTDLDLKVDKLLAFDTTVAKNSQETSQGVTDIQEKLESIALKNESIWDQQNKLLVALKEQQECLSTLKANKQEPMVQHTILVSPDLKRLEENERFDKLETLGGERVTLGVLPVLNATKRDIDMSVEQAKANWSLFGASTKEGRADVLANNPKHEIPAEQIFQAQSDVNFTIGHLANTLKSRPISEDAQQLLLELKRNQVPLLEKIAKLYEVGITADKGIEFVTINQSNEERNRIFKLLLLVHTEAMSWLEVIQKINNHIYEKTKGDKEIVGAADNLNYKNHHLLTALVLQYKKEVEDKKLAEAQKNNSNNSSDQK